MLLGNDSPIIVGQQVGRSQHERQIDRCILPFRWAPQWPDRWFTELGEVADANQQTRTVGVIQYGLGRPGSCERV